MIRNPSGTGPGDSTVVGLARTFRPWQWYKQLVLYVPVVFAGAAGAPLIWGRVTLGVLVFSVVAGSTYTLNDVSDRERDRLHPRKQHRPIASNVVSVPVAVVVALSGYLLSLSLSWILDPLFTGILCVYILQNAAYNYGLKQLAFVDLFSISVGFVLRALAGIVLVGSPISPWLLLCSFLAALLLATAKRLDEHREVSRDASRQVLDDYSEEVLHYVFTTVSATLLVSYSLYTFFEEEVLMMTTIPFAFYAVFRFTQVLLFEEVSRPPRRILIDRALVVNLLLWGLLIVFVLYRPGTIGSSFLGPLGGLL